MTQQAPIQENYEGLISHRVLVDIEKQHKLINTRRDVKNPVKIFLRRASMGTIEELSDFQSLVATSGDACFDNLKFDELVLFIFFSLDNYAKDEELQTLHEVFKLATKSICKYREHVNYPTKFFCYFLDVIVEKFIKVHNYSGSIELLFFLMVGILNPHEELELEQSLLDILKDLSKSDRIFKHMFQGLDSTKTMRYIIKGFHQFDWVKSINQQ